MLEGDDFVVTGEDDLVLADDGAASDGVDTDLVLGAFFAVGVKLILGLDKI